MPDDDDYELVRQLKTSLTETGTMVAVAESSTGGLVSSQLTNVPGSSEYFDRGIVTYSNRAKMDLLNVHPDTLECEGAVSTAVARQMARGVSDNAETRYGVSTTGIAGPSGGTSEKPVGTVFIGVADSTVDGVSTSATQYQFDGTRLECKDQFTQQALTDLLELIESEE